MESRAEIEDDLKIGKRRGARGEKEWHWHAL